MNEITLDRRHFMKATSAWTLAGLMSGSAASTVLAQSADPQRGGELRWNLNNDPASFDLLVNTGGVALQVLGPCYSGLVQYDPFDQTRVIGHLAESWTVSEDGKTYTFKLIPDRRRPLRGGHERKYGMRFHRI